jgi:hypothetical protein
MIATPCECSGPGFCPRHHCEKTPHWHYLCQTRADYFQLWEEGRGPGQNLPGPASAAAPPAPRSPCNHRGAAVREEVCPTCQGHVRLKVFACTIHTECTIARTVGGVACCATCSDYQAADAAQAQ